MNKVLRIFITLFLKFLVRPFANYILKNSSAIKNGLRYIYMILYTANNQVTENHLVTWKNDKYIRVKLE